EVEEKEARPLRPLGLKLSLFNPADGPIELDPAALVEDLARAFAPAGLEVLGVDAPATVAANEKFSISVRLKVVDAPAKDEPKGPEAKVQFKAWGQLIIPEFSLPFRTSLKPDWRKTGFH